MRKAVLWKRRKISLLSQDKVSYHEMKITCRSAINKFNSAKELELIRKNNLGSFYKYANKRLHPRNFEPVLKRADGSMTDDCGEKAHISSMISLLVCSPVIMTVHLSYLGVLTWIHVSHQLLSLLQ